MSPATANLTVAGAVLLTGLSLLLLLVGLVSYTRTKSARLGWVSLAFAAFTVQGFYLSIRSYRDRAEIAEGSAGPYPVLIFLDVLIVVFLYLAAVKR
jgi:hypothetical protein